ncbi:MAG: galactokinase [Paludibacter sp.]|nr:galactokinase [Paludibacter sp.]
MTVQELKSAFTFEYNIEPDSIYFASGRINLIGECIARLDDSIFPTVLSYGIYLLLRKNNDKCIKFWSLNEPEAINLEVNKLIQRPVNSWIKHPLNVFNQLINRGIELTYGYDMLFWGNIPTGVELSATEGLELITTFALRDQLNESNENKTSSNFIHNNKHYFSFINWDIIQLNPPIEIHERITSEMIDVKIVISNTHTPHRFNTAPYYQRISECKLVFEYLDKIKPLHDLDELSEDEFNSMVVTIDNPTAIKAVYHIISEVHRTKKAAIALKEGNLTLFGMLMNASHESLRENLEIVSPEVDYMVAQAWSIDGVIGSRMTGCGLGGCTISLVKEEAIDIFIEKVGAAYESQTGIKPEFYIAEIGDSACKLK